MPGNQVTRLRKGGIWKTEQTIRRKRQTNLISRENQKVGSKAAPITIIAKVAPNEANAICAMQNLADEFYCLHLKFIKRI